MTRYKLTDQKMQTHGGFRWELGKTYTTSGKGDLCDPGWLHCHDSPLLAVLLNPIHANIQNPRLFECECGGLEKNDHGLKRGYTEMTLVHEIPVPVVTAEQRTRFGILCARHVYREPGWTRWADGWLDGTDRTARAAEAAARAAWAAGVAAGAAAWAAAATETPLDLVALAEQAVA